MPETAEALMRSRYTAFVREERDYLLATWHPDRRPGSLDFDVGRHWLGLRIQSKKDGLASDDTGQVSFVARFKVAGRAYRLEENSQFTRWSGRWVYVSPVVELSATGTDTRPNDD